MAWVAPVVAAVAALGSAAMQSSAQKTAAGEQAGADALAKMRQQGGAYQPTAIAAQQDDSKPLGFDSPRPVGEGGLLMTPQMNQWADNFRNDRDMSFGVPMGEPGQKRLSDIYGGGADQLYPGPKADDGSPQPAAQSDAGSTGSTGSTYDYARLATGLVQSLMNKPRSPGGGIPSASNFNYTPTAARLADLYRV